MPWSPARSASMKPVRIEPIGLRQQRRDLLGKPHAYSLGPPPGDQFRALRERGNFAKPRAQNTAEGSALVAAHVRKRSDDLGEAGSDRRLSGAPLLLALLDVADLHHALERQQAIERRRRCLDPRCKLSHRRQDRFEHRGVDPLARRFGDPLGAAQDTADRRRGHLGVSRNVLNCRLFSGRFNHRQRPSPLPLRGLSNSILTDAQQVSETCAIDCIDLM